MLSRSLTAMRRAALAGAAVAGLFAVCAAPSYAVVVHATAAHGAIGYVPSVGSQQASPFACGNGQNCSAITYHGGVVQHAEKLIPIYWVPANDSIPAQYETDVNAWIKNFGALDYGPKSVFSVSQQYYDTSGPSGAKRFVPDALALAGAHTMTTAYPASGCTDQQNSVNTTYCFTQSQEATAVQNYVAASHLPTGLGTEYLLFTAPDVGSCFDSSSGSCSYTTYCAYHSYVTVGSSQILWANEPWIYQVNGCDLQYMGYGAGYASQSQADPEFSVLSHEMNETMTDPNLNAWYDTSGNENGDKCAYNYNGSAVADFTGLSNNGFGYYNQVAGGKDYLMQYEFSDENSDGLTTGCQGKDTDSQPTVSSVSPTTATRGVAQSFHVTVTSPAAALAYTQWNFGDGTPVVTTTATSLSHTYSTTLASGTRHITVIVTDGRGNEKRGNTAITLS